MKPWFGPLAVLLACAVAAHFAVLQFAPGLIMSRALDELARRGVALHDFTAPQRITPQTQTVVRPSPDLFYALCRYDLNNPGMELVVRMAEWPDYQSLSFFDSGTDNFASLRGTDKAVTVRLLAPGSAPQEGAIISPSAKGVILIRRLAPDALSFAAAAETSAQDHCRIEAEPSISRPDQE